MDEQPGDPGPDEDSADRADRDDDLTDADPADAVDDDEIDDDEIDDDAVDDGYDRLDNASVVPWTGGRAPIPLEDLDGFPTQARPATPSAGSRWAAFIAILIGGACGGLIGYGFTDLQCTGDCGNLSAFGGLAGAVIGAGGVAIVAVLGLRAIGEWETIKDRDEPVTRGRRR